MCKCKLRAYTARAMSCSKQTQAQQQVETAQMETDIQRRRVADLQDQGRLWWVLS